MSETDVRQNVFTISWDRSSTPRAAHENSSGFSYMRPWQAEAFEILKASNCMILNAPMGSGKSWLMCLLSAYKMKTDASLRCIIGVPQTIIASGFTEAKLVMPTGEEIDWAVRHNLCVDDPSQGTVQALIKWLERPYEEFSDRIMLCTHATLLRVHLKLQREGRLDLLNNLLLWIDEAHHVMNMTFEDIPDKIENNGIGKHVEYLLSQSEKNIQIGLTTASFFRGDRRALLTKDMEERFVRYNLPYDKYLKSMEHLESFGFDFLICGYDYIKGIELLIKQHRRKDIIYIPHPNSQHSIQGKLQAVENIISKYKETHGGKERVTKEEVLVLENTSGTFKIVDLVDDHPLRRSQRKSYLHQPALKKDRESLDAIISLNMFKEGANWIWADRSIIAGTRSSLVDIIQMIGRVFRDAEGKKHAEVIQLLPFSLDQKNEIEFRANLNDYLKAIYASLILENILDPVQIRLPKQSREKANTTDSEDKQKQSIAQDWLKVAVPDESKQQSLIEAVGNQLMNVKAEKKEALTWEEHKEIALQVVLNNGVEDYPEEVAQQILGIFMRKTLRLQGISVTAIDFDIVKESEPLEFLLRYTSGVCGIHTFQQLREAIQIRRSWRPFEEAREWVRNLKLVSETDWRAYIAGERLDLSPLPDDIPKAPWAAYEGKGWVSSGDFLGTNITAPRLRKYKSYEDAHTFAKGLQLKRKEDWPLYTKGQFPHLPPLPDDIAACPDKTYRRKDYGQKWTGWGDFLGTGSISNQNRSKTYLPHHDAKKFVQPLGLKSSGDWRKYISGELPLLPPLPPNMPKKPDQVYENFEWSDFLGSEISKMNSQRDFWTFKDSREFVRRLGLKSFQNWIDYCAGKFTNLPQKPLEIPSNPQKKYKDGGWVNYADWMGY